MNAAALWIAVLLLSILVTLLVAVLLKLGHVLEALLHIEQDTVRLAEAAERWMEGREEE